MKHITYSQIQAAKQRRAADRAVIDLWPKPLKPVARVAVKMNPVVLMGLVVLTLGAINWTMGA